MVQANKSFSETESHFIDPPRLVFRVSTDKLSDFIQESALALYKTVLLCVSALSLGLLPGKGLGNTWPPFQAQVRNKK